MNHQRIQTFWDLMLSVEETEEYGMSFILYKVMEIPAETKSMNSCAKCLFLRRPEGLKSLESRWQVKGLGKGSGKDP